MDATESVRFYEDQFYYRLQRRDFNKKLEEFFENRMNYDFKD